MDSCALVPILRMHCQGIIQLHSTVAKVALLFLPAASFRNFIFFLKEFHNHPITKTEGTEKAVSVLQDASPGEAALDRITRVHWVYRNTGLTLFR